MNTPDASRSGLGKAGRTVAIGAAVLITLLSVGAAALVWRLSRGPVSLDALVPVVEEVLVALADGRAVEIGTVSLSWGGFAYPVAVEARDVRVLTQDRQPMVDMDRLLVAVSARHLLAGAVAPTRLEIENPALTLSRTETGALVFGDQLVDGEPSARNGSDAAEASPLAGFLDGPPDADGPLALLEQVRVTGLRGALDDGLADRRWEIEKGGIQIDLDDTGADVRAQLALAVSDQPPMSLGAAGRFDWTDGHGDAVIEIADLRPTLLAAVGQDLAPLAGLETVLAGRVRVGFDREVGPVSVGFEAGAEAGIFRAEGGTGALLGFRDFAIKGTLEPAAGALLLDSWVVELTDPAVRIAGSGSFGLTAHGPEAVLDLSLAPAAGGPAAGLVMTALPAEGGGTAVDGQLTGLDLSAFSQVLPVLAPLAGAQTLLGGYINGNLNEDGSPAVLAVDLSLAPGQIEMPAVFPATVTIKSGALKAWLEGPLDAPKGIHLERAALDFGHGRIEAKATARRDGDLYRLRGRLDGRDLEAPSLPGVWPPFVEDELREWFVESVLDGIIDHAWADLGGTVSAAADRIDIPDVAAGLSVRDATIRYFKALPPIVGISGTAVADHRTFTMQTEGGRVGDIVVGPGEVRLTNLDSDNEYMEIGAPMEGPLASKLALLDYPPLGYATKFDIVPAETSGTARTELGFAFRLLKDLDEDDISVTASSQIRDASFRDLAGFRITGGDLALALTNDGMRVEGSAGVDGVPARVVWEEWFADEAAIKTRVRARGVLQKEDLAARNLVFPPYRAGPVAADLTITIDGNDTLTLRADANLSDALLTLPELYWEKPVGRPAEAQFVVHFQDDRPARITGLAFEAGDLNGSGVVDFDPRTGAFRRLRLSEFRMGASDLGGDLIATGDGFIRILGHGKRFDAVEIIARVGERDGEPAGTEQDQEPPPFQVRLQVDELLTAPGESFREVYADLVHDGQGWDRADFLGRLAASGGTVEMTYRPAGRDRSLVLRTNDFGGMLRAFDIQDRIQGGQFVMTGTGDHGHPDRPIIGRAEAQDFTVLEAPVLARLLNALSISGLIELLEGEGITFARLITDYRWTTDRVDISELRASGGAVGLTMDGVLDMADDRFQARGTIVPVYGVNRIVGMIPILGDILSGGEGEGIFAATYTAGGSFSAPEVSVNPLSMLAPGFLRRLFFQGGSEKLSSER